MWDRKCFIKLIPWSISEISYCTWWYETKWFKFEMHFHEWKKIKFQIKLHWNSFLIDDRSPLFAGSGLMLNSFQATMISLIIHYLNGLVQERLNSSALAVELRLSCTNPSISYYSYLSASQQFRLRKASCKYVPANIAHISLSYSFFVPCIRSAVLLDNSKVNQINSAKIMRITVLTIYSCIKHILCYIQTY